MAPFCCECCAEMVCAKNEVLVHMHGVVRAGDRFECPTCLRSVVVNFATKYLSPTEQRPDPEAFLLRVEQSRRDDAQRFSEVYEA